MFSAVWIVVANSWQQTPAGYHIVGTGLNARAEITDFWAMVFNPSSVDRLLHVWVGAILAGAFLVLSVHGYYLLKNRYVELSQKAFKIALVVAAVFSFTQLLTGHKAAVGVSVNQPAKLAAFEGHFDSLAVADMYLFGWVNKDKQEVYGPKIPGGLSYLTHFDFNTPLKGLNYFPENERPPAVNAVFQFYHIMIALGMLMIGLTLLACWLWWRGKLFRYRWLLWIFVIAVLFPQIANQVGWFSAEMGRQPWVVYGLLRTSDAFSKSVTANQIVFSLIMFAFIYVLLFALFIYLLDRKIKHGPYDESEIEDRPLQHDIADVLENR
jgi:cytochrome bd ubiquinol oxidase subunit I